MIQGTLLRQNPTVNNKNLTIYVKYDFKAA